MKLCLDTISPIDPELSLGVGRPPSCPPRPRRPRTTSPSCFGSKQMPPSESVSRIFGPVPVRGLMLSKVFKKKKLRLRISFSVRPIYSSTTPWIFFSRKRIDGVKMEEISRNSPKNRSFPHLFQRLRTSRLPTTTRYQGRFCR